MLAGFHFHYFFCLPEAIVSTPLIQKPVKPFSMQINILVSILGKHWSFSGPEVTLILSSILLLTYFYYWFHTNTLFQKCQ